MECPVNTVKTRMFHARRKLKPLLLRLQAAGGVARCTTIRRNWCARACLDAASMARNGTLTDEPAAQCASI